MELNAGGWDLETHDTTLAGTPMVNLYVVDMATNWAWACSVARADFIQQSTAACEDTSLYQAIRDTTSYLIHRAADKLDIDVVDGLTWEHQLGCFLTLYAGTTVTWQKANKFENGGHFIVIMYRKSNETNGKLRPFGNVEYKGILPFKELEKSVQSVVAHDRKHNSQWFK